MRLSFVLVALLAQVACEQHASNTDAEAATSTSSKADSFAPQTLLSRKLLPLVNGGRKPTRRQVVAALGPPSWVFIRGDKGDYAPEGDAVALLAWDNGDTCNPILVDVDASDRVIGSDGGVVCSTGAGAVFARSLRATKDASCTTKARARFCAP